MFDDYLLRYMTEFLKRCTHCKHFDYFDYNKECCVCKNFYCEDYVKLKKLIRNYNHYETTSMYCIDCNSYYFPY